MEAPGENGLFEKPFAPYKMGATSNALNTMLRNQYRMLARYVSLVDSKAKILIQMNSLIISGVVVFFKVFGEFTTAEVVVLIILLIAAVGSLVLAASASRPIPLKDPSRKGKADNPEEYLFDVVRFGELDETIYEKAFDTMMRDQGLIYKNMARDLYFGTNVMLRKFKLLRSAYNAFLIGLGVTAILYSILMIIEHLNRTR